MTILHIHLDYLKNDFCGRKYVVLIELLVLITWSNFSEPVNSNCVLVPRAYVFNIVKSEFKLIIHRSAAVARSRS